MAEKKKRIGRARPGRADVPSAYGDRKMEKKPPRGGVRKKPTQRSAKNGYGKKRA